MPNSSVNAEEVRFESDRVVVARVQEPGAWRLPLLLAIAYIISGFLLPGALRWIGALWEYRLPVVLGTLGVVPFAIGVVRCRVRAGGPAATGWPAGIRLAREEGWFGERLIWFIALLALVPTFFWAFAAWKGRVGPFLWDAEFAQLDRSIHGGDPYRLLPSSLRSVWLMDRFYWTWNYLFLVVMLWQGWAGSQRDRVHFWLAFIVTWIGLGTVLAHVFSSAGPCYFVEVTGTAGSFGPLQDRLADADKVHHLRLFTIRDYLWRAAQGREVVFGGGISAFPSLHVAMPMLASCAAWRVSRWLAVGFALYATLILVSAVGLGWHYAVDGYASMLLVPVVWVIAGRLSKPHKGEAARMANTTTIS